MTNDRLTQKITASYKAFLSGDTNLAIKSLVTSFGHRCNSGWTVPETMRILRFLVWLYIADHQPQRAISLLNRLLALQEACYGQDSPALALTLFNLGELSEKIGNHINALEHFRRLVKLLSESQKVPTPWSEAIEKRLAGVERCGQSNKISSSPFNANSDYQKEYKRRTRGEYDGDTVKGQNEDSDEYDQDDASAGLPYHSQDLEAAMTFSRAPLIACL